MSGENWNLIVDPSARKVLKRLSRRDQKAIDEAIMSMRRDPYTGDIEKMKGSKHEWRRRVRAYRIFYEIYPERKTVLIFHLERRTSTTY